MQTPTAAPYAEWLVQKLGEAVDQEHRALYEARLTDAAPLALTVVRHQCPHCRRTWSKKTAAAAHIARCWQNPAVRSCKTCDHFDPGGDACGCGPGCNWGAAGPTPPYCGAGLKLPDDDKPATDCPLWAALTDPA